MSLYNLSPIIDPVYVPNAAEAILFAALGAPAAVPAGYNYLISTCRVANKTAGIVTLKVWRVPSGDANDDQHIVLPTINVPAPSSTTPQFDLTALWGAVLQPGDAIWMLAGTANSLIVQADGAVISL